MKYVLIVLGMIAASSYGAPLAGDSTPASVELRLGQVGFASILASDGTVLTSVSLKRSFSWDGLEWFRQDGVYEVFFTTAFTADALPQGYLNLSSGASYSAQCSRSTTDSEFDYSCPLTPSSDTLDVSEK
jgi:hypothetical protein